VFGEKYLGNDQDALVRRERSSSRITCSNETEMERAPVDRQLSHTSYSMSSSSSSSSACRPRNPIVKLTTIVLFVFIGTILQWSTVKALQDWQGQFVKLRVEGRYDDDHHGRPTEGAFQP